MQLPSFLKRDAVLWALLFVAIVLLHRPLLSLPYFWDEAGHYIPAARDFMLSGDVIPTTTISNAHPPLPMFYLALAWSVFGYAPVVTRVAMLALSAFGLLQVFRLGERVANREVAIAATACTALYPVMFAQSSLAHADLMATVLALWGLRLYLDGSRWMVAALSLAVLAKETAILFSAVLFAWEVMKRLPSGAKAHSLPGANGTAEDVPFRKRLESNPSEGSGRIPHEQARVGHSQPLPVKDLFLLLAPGMVLALWFAYHYSRTGYVFGNPEFFQYNVGTTFVPLRILLAALRRIWQVTGYMNLWVLTVAMVAAMMLPPLADGGAARPRIAIPTQLLFLALILAHVAGHSLVGGAVLARYMMPAIPLAILIAVSTLWRRVRFWKWVVGFACVAFVVGWWVPPLTSYAPEDNLNYASYVRLHQKAAGFLEAKYPRARVLTAWPASDEIAHPYLGYVQNPLRTVRVEDFSFNQLMLARQNGDYDVALLFSTKTPRSKLRWHWWDKANARFFDLHEDVMPAAAALMLGGRVVYQETENGQWAGIVEIDRTHDAD